MNSTILHYYFMAQYYSDIIHSKALAVSLSALEIL